MSINAVARRSAIDAELTSLYERIALLKAERNSTAPFFSLPSELLAKIFGEIADPGPHITRSVLPALKRLMLVCMWWRDVALSTHTLWSKIATHWRNPDWGFRTQMIRSGDALVKINAGTYISSDFIFDNAHRLDTLHLTSTPSRLLDFLQEMGEHKFPSLRSLKLTPEHSHERETEVEMMDASLPSELFDGGMPHLCQLSLIFIAAPWRSLPPLQSLDLKGGANTPTMPIEWRVLVDLLRASRTLHTLKLDCIMTSGIREPRPVDLPCLELLRLRDFSDRCENVLFSLTFPATTRLELYPWGVSTGPEIRDILTPAQKHLCASGAPIPLALALRSSLDSHQYFSAATYADASQILDREVLFEISALPASDPALRQIITKVLRAMPTKTLTTLDATYVNFTVPTWKAALALLPAIENVDIRLHDAGTPFFEAALETCYWLRTISVHVSLPLEPRDQSATIIGFFDMLTRLLHAQHAIGRPLRQLEVSGLGPLNLSDEKWLELRGLVETLVVEQLQNP
ncbi:hypothetical protein C8R47DRAFT_1139764 [Mycena vitilis]|nr:hypothetical protein C8R47DRAFT_1139764 [Mycena vitilis]